MLPAEIVRQVRRIQLTTGRQVADVLAGAYQSVFRGRGVEFDEVRPYVPGDDVRTIDWNVTARVGSPRGSSATWKSASSRWCWWWT